MAARSSTRAGVAVAAVAATALMTALTALPAAAEPPDPTRTIESAGNPIIADGSYYSADAAPLVVGDTLYVYTGHDEAGPQTGTFVMNDYGVLATDDVEAGVWEHYPDNLLPGEVFDWATGNAAYAGHVTTGADGRFYWYAPVQWERTDVPNRMVIGVAVSDSPVGPWEDAIGEPLLTWTDVFGGSANGQELIDPHVFTDDDGRVWMYWGAWSVARVVELEPTMTELKGEIQVLSGLTSFFEAPWVFKRGDTYYLAYDWKQAGSGCTPSNYQACVAYATADNPLGPWTYQGIILGGTSATTVHPSIIEFDGAWYLTYHTKDAVGGGHFRRSVAIDEVRWDGDRILPVTPTWADDPAFRLRANVAPEAEVSASFTESPPMRLGAVNDGFRATTALLPPDQWGNYRGQTSTVASDWVMYQWDAPVRTDGMGIQFHRDANWIRPPASWAVEYLDGRGEWRPVEGAVYPTEVGAWHEVSFEPVTTTALRATFTGAENGPYYHSVSVSEWEVYSVQADRLVPVGVTTAPGVAPELPPAVRLPFGAAGELWVPVSWRPVDPQAYAVPGVFTVQGRALGQEAGYVTAVVTVTDRPSGGEDTQAPTVLLAPSGTSGEDGWFSSDVVVRVTADDETDYLLTVEGRVGEGEWLSADGVRHVEVTVTEEGETVVTGRARDAAGNTSAEVTRTVRIDATAPEVSAVLDEEARTVLVGATDALSGVAALEYRVDGAGAWQAVAAGAVITAPDALPHELAVRARDRAGNTRTVVVDIPLGDGAQLEGNLARYATPSASFTSSWESVAGLNDGTMDLWEDNAAEYGRQWGTWNRAGEQWARLDWGFDVTVDEIGVWWFRDTPDAGNAGMIPPRTWVLQYLDGQTWREVALDEGSAYGRRSDGFQRVAFAPVTTRALRIVAQSWGQADGGGSTGIREWQVAAAAAPEPEPLEVSVATAARCVAGRVVVTARVSNGEAVPVAAELASPFGSRSSAAVGAGTSVLHAFTTRQAQVAAGAIAVTVTAVVDGEAVSEVVEAPYAAHACR